MTDSDKLKDFVTQYMGEIIKDHGLQTFRVNEREVALRGNDYWIDVCVDQDGVSIIYFDTSAQGVIGYNLLTFLLNRRRERLSFLDTKPEVTTRDQFISLQLSSLASHLKRGAQDILNGSKEWLSSYSWPTIAPGKELLNVMSYK